MSKVLYIKANPKPEGASKTFQISDALVKAYKESHPEDEVTTLDLYKENIGFLSSQDLNDLYLPKTAETRNHPVLKYAYQFAEADKYIVAAPMWNLSFPAILKAYIDYVSVSGITFQYTEKGPIGMLSNKKAIHISTRGGQYSKGPTAQFEMGDRYLRTIFGFLGITDYDTVFADELNLQGNDIDAIIQNAIKEACEKAKNF